MRRPAIRGRLAALALATALPLVGCATRGSVHDLENRVERLETRLDEVNATAQRAETSAEAAQSAAERAADRADDAARTSEAIFRKGVSK